MPTAVILSALQLEYLAVRAHLTVVRELVLQQGTIYQVGHFEANNQTWEVLITEVGMGNNRAAVETERALSQFSPDVVMFIGIAGGLKDDVVLGDVVAASKVYGYESGKANEEFLPRPEINLASYSVEQRARQVARDNQWQCRTIGDHEGNTPKALVAPIAAGSQVVASNRAATFEFLRNAYSDAVAVEMEGHGFLEAARATSATQPLVVRGISDLVEGKAESDKEGWQLKVAANAAAFSFELLARYPVNQPVVALDLTADVVPQNLSASSRTSTQFSQIPTKIRSSIPLRVNSFTGRAAELENTRSVYNKERATPGPIIQMVSGLSGVGKTRLCREYAALFNEDYKQVFWVSASDQSQITSVLAQIAADLRLPGFSVQDLVESSQATLRWFEQTTDWLLIFDNASPSTIPAFLPTTGSGHVLISSNDPNWSAITTNHIRLKGLNLEDAVAFLSRRTGLPHSESATRIANDFEGLPLALEQAAAYIETTGIDFDSYEQLLASHRPELLDERSPFTEYPESVYSALSLNIERASEQHSLVTAILAFVGFLNSSGIPRSLVRDSTQVVFDQADLKFDNLVFNSLLASLSSVSLISLENNLLSTHSLVQTFVRDSLPDEHREKWCQFVLDFLADLFPHDIDNSSTWPLCESLIDHVTTASKLADYESWDNEFIEALYNNAGLYLHARGRNSMAHSLLNSVLVRATAKHGEEHPEVALAMSNLMDVLADLGRGTEALAMGNRAIEILTKHRNKRKSYAVNLGIAYSNLGRIQLHVAKDYEGAKLNIDRAFSIHRRSLGDIHHTTAIDINNLGTVLRAEGRWFEAYEHFAKAVRIHREVLNPNDYRLAIALFNLGTAAYNLKRYSESEVYLSEAVDIYDGLELGATGWDQAEALFGLAMTLKQLRKLKESLSNFERAIELGECLYGREAPKVKSMIKERGVVAFDLIRPLFCYYSDRCNQS